MNWGIKKIISGGQSGVDNAALDAAIKLKIPHGGCCPKGRLCETGRIPEKYNLIETDSEEYYVRTLENVKCSDGTLILSFDKKLQGGTLLTKKMAQKLKKPYLIINLNELPSNDNIFQWFSDESVNVLNIAGPRESKTPGIYNAAFNYLLNLLKD
ncbi:MAG: hypothetical protein ACD_79C00646G0003 [uncultured bacterium]|nr:MAG: hypothetical protein ACD_79C00646G0003 [uncultured bacterium]